MIDSPADVARMTRSVLPLPTRTLPVEKPPGVSGAVTRAEVREAQCRRHRVFAGEMGARVLGPPAWNSDFRCADLPLPPRHVDLPPRFRRQGALATIDL